MIYAAIHRLVWYVLLTLAATIGCPGQQGSLWKVEKGSVYFLSDAPLEHIEARSARLEGLLRPEAQTFAFSVPVASFQGFNSELQREHFNENYMESHRFPNVQFTGRIIDPVDLADGQYTVRVKGKLEVHGVARERIIKVDLKVADKKIRADAQFGVLLEEHKIAIPRIVHQKIAEEIQVKVSLVLVQSR